MIFKDTRSKTDVWSMLGEGVKRYDLPEFAFVFAPKPPNPAVCCCWLLFWPKPPNPPPKADILWMRGEAV